MLLLYQGNKKMKKEELNDIAIYDQALEIICDSFYDGRIPDDKSSQYHKAASMIAEWAINIRDTCSKEISS